jgi:hypothetical protein
LNSFPPPIFLSLDCLWDLSACLLRAILIIACHITSAPIAKALVNARKRGVSVEAILDKSQRTAKYTGATFLTNGDAAGGGDMMGYVNRHRKNIFFVPIYLSFTSGSDFLPILRFCKGLKW